MAYGQLKVGPELISNSREAWLGYYTFAALTIISLGGGYYLIRRSGLERSDYWMALVAILLFSLISLGICIMCHLMGHLIDTVDALGQKRD